VFEDRSDRTRLETILHPLIRSAAQREMAAWTSPYGVLVVPLLFERGGLSGTASRVLVVDCPEDLQVQRAAARSGQSPAEIRAIMATQLSRAERLARADDVILNAGLLAAIAPRVAELDHRYRELAARGASAPDRAA
jgi:dephospho-CoA kinase